MRIAAFFALLLPALAAQPATGSVHASPRALDAAPSDFTSVSAEARLPDSGHVRFVRMSRDGMLIFVGLTTGLQRSADGGRTWQEIRSGVPGGVGTQLLDLQIAGSDARIVWAAGLTGVFRSTDGGQTWHEADARNDAPGRAIGSVLAVDPRHPEAAYLAGYRNGGLYRTGDGGLSWQQVLSYPVSGLAIEPASGAIIYVVSRTAGVQRSTDHGQTWSSGVHLPAYTGVGEEAVAGGRLLAFDGPGGGLYAALDGGGIERSTDGGQTWLDVSAGLPHSTPGQGFAVPYDLVATGGVQPSLYAIVPSGVLGASAGGTLYRARAPLAQQAGMAPVSWQAAGAQVDAVAIAPSAAAPLVAAEASPSSGLAATVATLGGPTILNLPYRLPPPLARVAGSGFAYGDSPLPYLGGVNYEGPNDRPWHMWEDSKFDPTLIARDLDAAAATGYRVLRVFVQDPLPAQVLAGRFGHLDTLVTLARQRDQRLLVTFNDNRDPDLSRVALVDRTIAAHLAGNPTIFGYDLQNEPGIQDIVAAIYPSGVTGPLQDTALIQRYGESVSLKKIRADRAAGKWQGAPFDHMTDRQVYTYLNVAGILDDFFSANPGYPIVAAGAHWAPLLSAINGDLATYLHVLMGAVRSVDPRHLITVGYNSYFWSSLPANDALDFRTIHLYPGTKDFSSMHGSLRFFEILRGLAASPLVLGEYGFSTALQSGSVASVQETAMSLYLRVLGGSGDIKWVLNDDTVGYNPYENGLGLFGAGGTPKTGYFVNRELAAYFGGPHQPGGVRMWDDSTVGVGYLYTAPDALGVSGGSYSDARLRYQAHANAASAQLWMDWAQQGRLRLVSTHEADLNTDLAALVGARSGPLTLSPAQPFDLVGLKVHLHMQAGVWYSLSFTPGPALPPLVPDLPAPAQEQGWYVLATGHNVLPPFLKLWLSLGGTSLAGLPLDEAQPAAHGPVQYFTALALQGGITDMHLLPLGLAARGGHPAPPVPELPKKEHHRYFPTTGHNLRAGFLTFWEANGGEAVWGPPLDEEHASGSVIVQYFANAEFVWHGSSISLAPLGARAWATGTH